MVCDDMARASYQPDDEGACSAASHQRPSLVGAILLILRTQGPTFWTLWLATFASWFAFAAFIIWRAFILKPRSIQLQADKEAAQSVGRESLLKVLLKLQGLGLSNIQCSPTNPLRISPSIHERIENLT